MHKLANQVERKLLKRRLSITHISNHKLIMDSMTEPLASECFKKYDRITAFTLNLLTIHVPNTEYYVVIVICKFKIFECTKSTR